MHNSFNFLNFQHFDTIQSQKLNVRLNTDHEYFTNFYTAQGLYLLHPAGLT